MTAQFLGLAIPLTPMTQSVPNMVGLLLDLMAPKCRPSAVGTFFDIFPSYSE